MAKIQVKVEEFVKWGFFDTDEKGEDDRCDGGRINRDLAAFACVCFFIHTHTYMDERSIKDTGPYSWEDGMRLPKIKSIKDCRFKSWNGEKRKWWVQTCSCWIWSSRRTYRLRSRSQSQKMVPKTQNSI